MEDLPIWVQVLIGVFGTGGSATALVALLRERARSKRSKDMTSGFRDIHEAYEELQQLLSRTSADRILILKSQNGGGLPKPGCDIKTSVWAEAFNGSLGSIRDTWQRVPLDYQYSEILNRLGDGRWVFKKTEDLGERSLLRDMLEPSVSFMVNARICGTANALWYIVLHFREITELPESERVLIAATVHRLRLLFGYHQTLVKRESEEK